MQDISRGRHKEISQVVQRTTCLTKSGSPPHFLLPFTKCGKKSLENVIGLLFCIYKSFRSCLSIASSFSFSSCSLSSNFEKEALKKVFKALGLKQQKYFD